MLGTLIARFLKSLPTPVVISGHECLQAVRPEDLAETDFVLLNADQLVAADWDYLSKFRRLYPEKRLSAVTQLNPDKGRFMGQRSIFDRVFCVATDLDGLGNEVLAGAGRPGSWPVPVRHMRPN